MIQPYDIPLDIDVDDLPALWELLEEFAKEDEENGKNIDYNVTLVNGGCERPDMVAVRMLIRFPDVEQAKRFMGVHEVVVKNEEHEWHISGSPPETEGLVGAFGLVEDDVPVIRVTTLTSICDDDTPLPDDLTGLCVSELFYAVYDDKPEYGGGPCNPTSIDGIEFIFSDDTERTSDILCGNCNAIVEEACRCPIKMCDVKQRVMGV